jgi:hypothetical protein
VVFEALSTYLPGGNTRTRVRRSARLLPARSQGWDRDLPPGLEPCLQFWTGGGHGKLMPARTEELLCGLLVSSTLDQDVQHVAVLIDRPPERGTLSCDRQKYLAHVPLISGPRTAATQLSGELLATRATPFADGLRGHDHATCQQEFFDIADAQAEAKVPPHGVTDDLHGTAVILLCRGGGGCAHAAALSYRRGAGKLTMPSRDPQVSPPPLCRPSSMLQSVLAALPCPANGDDMLEQFSTEPRG